ncbi:hypothetical protein LINPERHAP1_LOCUS27228 [Linum perenne]
MHPVINHPTTKPIIIVGGGGVSSKEKYSKLERLVKEKDEELAKLKVEKDKKEAECKENYSKLERLAKEKDEELVNLKREKDKKETEYQLLQQGKFAEEAKTRKVEGELKEAREKLGQLILQFKALEQTKKESWAILSSTKFLPQGSDNNLPTRKRYPPENFSCYPYNGFPNVTNSPKLIDNMYVWGNNFVKLVDEGSTSTWPSPPKVAISIGTNGQEFDKNDWWYVKTTHPEGGLTMLVYYDGNRSQISLGAIKYVIPLPFPKGITEFISHTYNMSLFNLFTYGMRLGFTYRS